MLLARHLVQQQGDLAGERERGEWKGRGVGGRDRGVGDEGEGGGREQEVF